MLYAETQTRARRRVRVSDSKCRLSGASADLFRGSLRVPTYIDPKYGATRGARPEAEPGTSNDSGRCRGPPRPAACGRRGASN